MEARLGPRREGDGPGRAQQAAAVLDAFQPQAQQDLRQQVGRLERRGRQRPGHGNANRGMTGGMDGGSAGGFVKHFGSSVMETPGCYP